MGSICLYDGLYIKTIPAPLTQKVNNAHRLFLQDVCIVMPHTLMQGVEFQTPDPNDFDPFELT